MASIAVRHNVEMAHRLSLTPGKCEQVHGHSWWVELHIQGPVNSNGMILEYGDVKQRFRQYLDENFDHRVLLHQYDPVADYPLPGIKRFHADPTTENFAHHIWMWAHAEFGQKLKYRVVVWETSVNCAIVEDGSL